MSVTALLAVALAFTTQCHCELLGGRSKVLDKPVTKVIKLLEKMHEDLEQSMKKDQKAYDRLKCWCKTGSEDKTKAVEEGLHRLDELQHEIEGASGEEGRLSAEIAQLKNDQEEGERALKEATELRRKEAAAFHNQDKDLVESMQLLRGAIAALAKHHPAMLQGSEASNEEVAAMKPALRHLVHRHLDVLAWLQDSDGKGAFLKFLDAEPDILESDLPADRIASPAALLQRGQAWLPYRAYAPQSGQVFGVLKQMLDSFQADLSEAQKGEQAKQEVFAELKGAKSSELADIKASLQAKSEELAGAKERLATAKRDREDTKNALGADQAFLLELTSKCTEGDAEWERRSKLRADELEAVSQAVAVLSADSVQDAQRAAFSLVQIDAQHQRSKDHGDQALEMAAEKYMHSTETASPSEKERTATAAQYLRRVAAAVPEARRKDLILLAASASAGGLEKVVEAVDKLIQKLKIEQADEVKARDLCIDEFHENEVQFSRRSAEHDKLGAEVEEAVAKAKALGDELKALQADVEEMQVQLQRATLQRKAESLEYQSAAVGRQETIAALKEAKTILAEVYMKRGVLLQKAPAEPWTAAAAANMTAAPELESYSKHSSSNRVLTLMEELIGETRALVAASVTSEQNAQAAYESLIRETNAAVKAKARLITDKEEDRASVDERRLRLVGEQEEAAGDLEALNATEDALHNQCDFLLKNFDLRQEARAAEMDALGNVKAILKGMKST